MAAAPAPMAITLLMWLATVQTRKAVNASLSPQQIHGSKSRGAARLSGLSVCIFELYVYCLTAAFCVSHKSHGNHRAEQRFAISSWQEA